MPTLAGMAAGFCLAQEPGLLKGRQAVRFEEAPGLYHYITPCSEKADADGSVPDSWCWPVRAAFVQRVDGKVVQSDATHGVIRISPDEVQFIPNPEGSKITLKTFPRTAVIYGHAAGSTEARYGTNDGVYIFLFQNLCFGCNSSNAFSDPAKAAQLETEFALFKEALNDYPVVAERLAKLSAPLLVKVTPHAEPTASASATTMSKYAELNRRLSDICTDPEKSCVLKYTAYQLCKAGVVPADCGPEPTCTAEVVLPKDFSTEGISVILPKLEDAAELRPAGVSQGNLGPARLSAGIVAGQIVERTAPEYPSMAKARHLSGRVTMHAVITKEGTIRLLEVSSSTDSIFNQAALDAVKTWRYRPYILNGEPCEVDTIITVNFNLNGGSGSVSQGPSGPSPMPGMPPS